MAAPITHIVLLNKIADKYLPTKDRAALVVGTSFPDIRYLGVIDRDKTHFPINKLNEAIDKNSFITGLKFHSLVDVVREKYMVENEIYSFYDDSPYVSQAIKIFEDVVLYDKITDWSEINKSFDVVYPEEEKLGVENSEIKRWHVLLQKYLATNPSDTQTRIFIDGLGRSGMADEVIRIFKSISDEEEVRKIINNFYDQFETLVSE